MTDTPMTCAHCGEKYPWERAYWPSTTYAECWRCWAKDLTRRHHVELVSLRIALAFAIVITALTTWAVMR